MAPLVPPSSRATLAQLARRALVTAGPAAAHELGRRGLTVNHTQGVTLGVIIAYVVVIALLWNLPYVRWVLWPFKVSFFYQSQTCSKKVVIFRKTEYMLISDVDARDRLPRIRPRHHCVLHRWSRRVHLAGSARGRRHAHAWWETGHHAAGWVPWVQSDWGAAHVLRVQYRGEQGCEYRAGGMLLAHAVVGAEGLVDDHHDLAGGGIVGCVLVYQAC